MIGYYLEVINGLTHLGIPVRISIRAGSSAADVLSALLVFEILRRRRSLPHATIGGLGVAASPLLLLVASYHGNTDPLFVMLVLLGMFLIVDTRLVFLGGAALALALGVTIVPTVVLPCLAVYLVRHRREVLGRGVTGFGLTLAVTWGPAVVSHGEALKRNVFGYAGIDYRPWGLVRLANDLGWSSGAHVLVGPGRYVIVAVSAAVPALLVWRRQEKVMECAALSLAVFLALSTAFGVQYLAWAVAPAYLLDVWSATLYSMFGGLVLYQIYAYWNHGLAWVHAAGYRPLTPDQGALLAMVWASLLAVLVVGLQRVLADDPEGDMSPALSGAADQTQ